MTLYFISGINPQGNGFGFEQDVDSSIIEELLKAYAEQGNTQLKAVKVTTQTSAELSASVPFGTGKPAEPAPAANYERMEYIPTQERPAQTTPTATTETQQPKTTATPTTTQPKNKSNVGMLPYIGGKIYASTLIQVYARKIRDKLISKQLHEKLHPLV